MKIRFLCALLCVSSSSYSMNSQTVSMSTFDLKKKCHVLKHVSRAVCDQVGKECDDKLLKAKRKRFFNYFNDGFEKLGSQKHNEALKLFAFALQISKELPAYLEIVDATNHARRMIAEIYRQKKEYDTAAAWLQILIDQGDMDAHRDLALLLEEQVKTIPYKKRYGLRKKVKELYAYIAASGDHYGKVCFAHLLTENGRVDEAARDFSTLLQVSNDPHVRDESVRGLRNCVDHGNFFAQCELITHIPVSKNNAHLLDMFESMFNTLVKKINKKDTDISIKAVLAAIQKVEQCSKNYGKRAYELLGRSYYEVSKIVSGKKQQQLHKKAFNYLKKIESPKSLYYQACMYLYGHGVKSSIERAFQITNKLEQTAAGALESKRFFDFENGTAIQILNKLKQNGGQKSYYAACMLGRYYHDKKEFKTAYDCFMYGIQKGSPLEHDNFARVFTVLAQLHADTDAAQVTHDALHILKPIFFNKSPQKDSGYYAAWVALCQVDNMFREALIKQEKFELLYQLAHFFLQYEKTASRAFVLVRTMEKVISTSEDRKLARLIKTSGVYSKCVEWAKKDHLNACDILVFLHVLRGKNENECVYLLGGEGKKDVEKGLFYQKKMLDLIDEADPHYQKNINFYCNNCNRLAQLYWKEGKKQKAVKLWDKAIGYNHEQSMESMAVELFLLPVTQKNKIFIQKAFALAQKFISKKGVDIMDVVFLEIMANGLLNGLYTQESENILYKDERAAFAYAQSAAKRGGKIAHKLLAQLYQNGIKKNKKNWFLPPDKKKALEHYTKAIAAGDHVSLFYRGKLFYDQKYFDKAFQDFKKFIHVKKETVNKFSEALAKGDELALSHWYMATLFLKDKKTDKAIEAFQHAFRTIDRTGNVEQFYQSMTDPALLTLEKVAKDIVIQKRKAASDLELCYYIGRLLHKNPYSTKKEKHNIFKLMGLTYLKYAADHGDVWSQWYLGHMDKDNVAIGKQHEYLWKVFNHPSDNEFLKNSTVGFFMIDASVGYIPAIAYLLSCYVKQNRTKDIEVFLAKFYREYKTVVCNFDNKISLSTLMKSGVFREIKDWADGKKGSGNTQFGACIVLGCAYFSYASQSKAGVRSLMETIKYLEIVEKKIPAKGERSKVIKRLLGAAHYKTGLCWEQESKREEITQAEYDHSIIMAFNSWYYASKNSGHIEAQCKLFEGMLDDLWEIKKVDALVNILVGVASQDFSFSVKVNNLLQRYYRKERETEKVLLRSQTKPKFPSVPNYHVVTDPNDVRKLIKVEKAKQADNAQYKRAVRLEQQKKYKQARKKLENLAKQNHPHACIRLSTYYLRGKNKGTNFNGDLALEYLAQGLDHGGLTEDKKYLDYELAKLIVDTIKYLGDRVQDARVEQVLGSIMSLIVDERGAQLAPKGTGNGKTT